MTSPSPTSCDLEKQWLNEAFRALKQLFQTPLTLWTSCDQTGWTQSPLGSSLDQFSLPSPSDDLSHNSYSTELVELLDLVSDQRQSRTAPISPRLHLLAIPLFVPSGRSIGIATATFETDTPKLLVRMAEIGQQFFNQQEEIERLCEENRFFLKQVSDDFEELTFLKSMAESLDMGDDNHTLEDMMDIALPQIGSAIRAESLYFFRHSDKSPLRVSASWNAENEETRHAEPAVLCDLVQRFSTAARQQPVIKNQFDETGDCGLFPNVSEFILVSISTSTNCHGWLLAVNRQQVSQSVSESILWRLSQYEFGTCESSLLSTAAAMLASHGNNVELFQEREQLLVNTIRALVSTVEAKDPYTCGHSERVALYGKRLAEEVGYDQKDCELIYLTGLVHDVGKIAVSDAILNKPGLLTEEEFEEIKRHPDEGWAILRGLEQLQYVLPGVLHHHERFDGKGYPDCLSEEEIPLDGRVLAVADAYDAMTSNRAYRQGMSHDRAKEILRNGAGSQWDPDIVAAFLGIAEDVLDIRKNYQPRERPNRKAPATVQSIGTASLTGAG